MVDLVGHAHYELVEFHLGEVRVEVHVVLGPLRLLAAAEEAAGHLLVRYTIASIENHAHVLEHAQRAGNCEFRLDLVLVEGLLEKLLVGEEDAADWRGPDVVAAESVDAASLLVDVGSERGQYDGVAVVQEALLVLEAELLTAVNTVKVSEVLEANREEVADKLVSVDCMSSHQLRGGLLIFDEVNPTHELVHGHDI